MHILLRLNMAEGFDFSPVHINDVLVFSCTLEDQLHYLQLAIKVLPCVVKISKVLLYRNL